MWRAVIFDFDMTLVDSSTGVVECTNFALGKLGLQSVTKECAYKTIGLSLPETLTTLTGVSNRRMESDFIRYFLQRADEVMASLTTLYESVPQTLNLLEEQGYALAIVSTKFRYRIENILESHGLLYKFDVIVGGEDVAEHKPDPSGILTALTHLHLRPDEAVYVGDHIVDAEAAMRAGISFIGVLNGTCRREDFADYQVIRLIDNIGDLPSCLRHSV